MPIASNFNFAMSASRSSGTAYTSGLSSLPFVSRYSMASTWLAKLMSMTAAGLASAAT